MDRQQRVNTVSLIRFIFDYAFSYYRRFIAATGLGPRPMREEIPYKAVIEKTSGLFFTGKGGCATPLSGVAQPPLVVIRGKDQRDSARKLVRRFMPCAATVSLRTDRKRQSNKSLPHPSRGSS